MIADEIQELDKSGKLKLFLKAGVIPVRVKCQYDIFQFYKKELDKNVRCNDCIMQSISNTSEIFKVSERTVYTAIKAMKQ